MVVTAGNAPGLNDGASALVVTSEEYARAHGLEILARITRLRDRRRGAAGALLRAGRRRARLMEKEGKGIGDYDLIEANEAFAVQALADGKELGWDWDRVNVHGGAVALGHPIGASGARVLVTLLTRCASATRAETGLATLCLGGGDAVALSVERASGPRCSSPARCSPGPTGRTRTSRCWRC
jgi:acetyl-CoA C-acetyltransferase